MIKIMDQKLAKLHHVFEAHSFGSKQFKITLAEVIFYLVVFSIF